MKSVLFIEGRRNGYCPEDCGKTMAVGELIDYLSQFDENKKVFLRNDRGYTYGNIDFRSFEEEDEDNEAFDERD